MDELKVIRRGRLVFPLACVAVAALLAISEVSYRQSIGSIGELSATINARSAIRSVVQGVVDAETGQRGYLLTGRLEYREPYDRALATIAESLRQLDAYYAGDPASMRALAKMHGMVDNKLSELALTLRLQQEGKTAAGTEILLSGIGKEQMDQLRALGSELLDHESANIARSQNEIYRMLLVSRIGIALLSGIGLLALFLYVRVTYAFERQQQDLKRLLQAERDRLEIEVAQRTAQLTELALHLQTALEEERRRLARNLHDELGSLLTAAKLDAARMKSRLAGAGAGAPELLAHLVETLNCSIALGRRIIEDLRPSALGNLGLVVALEILAREFSESSGVPVHCTLEAVPLAPDAELTVYRLVQEAITNITKYAQASQVWVSLQLRDGRAHASVRDDGVGFDSSAKPTSAYGLLGMRFRVEADGGTLTLQSAPGRGTLVQATLPLAQPGPG